jgi:hypothetical protein
MVRNKSASLEIANVAAPDGESPIISLSEHSMVVSHGQIGMREMLFVLPSHTWGDSCTSPMRDRVVVFHSMSCIHLWRTEQIWPLDGALDSVGIAQAIFRCGFAAREEL